MGRQGKRDLGFDAGEQSTLLGERVYVRSAKALVSIGAQVIGAQGVDGDQDDWSGWFGESERSEDREE